MGKIEGYRMGKRGPKGDTKKIQKLKGNPSKRPIPDDGVEAYGSIYFSSHLPEEVIAKMHLIIASMPPDLYKTIDTDLIEDFSIQWWWSKKALLNLIETGAVEIGSQGQKVASPWFKILQDTTRLKALLGDKLGIGPKAREELKLKEDQGRGGKFQSLLGGKN